MMAWTTGCGAMASNKLSEEVSLSLSYLIKKEKGTFYFLIHSQHRLHSCILLQHFLTIKYTRNIISNSKKTMSLCTFTSRTPGSESGTGSSSWVTQFTTIKPAHVCGCTNYLGLLFVWRQKKLPCLMKCKSRSNFTTSEINHIHQIVQMSSLCKLWSKEYD